MNISKLFTISFLLLYYNLFAAELLSLHFYQKEEVSYLKMIFDKNHVNFKKFHITNDKQIIVDLLNVTAKEKIFRNINVSKFTGGIVLITPYKKPGTENDLRITIQLRENVRSIVDRSNRTITLQVENYFGVFSQALLHRTPGKPRGEDKTIHTPKSASTHDILANIVLSGKKRYIGEKISFNVKNISVSELLRSIANISGFNVITTKDIDKLEPMTLNLINTPWDHVLDTILSINKLIATKNNSILMITTLKSAIKNQKEEVESKKIITNKEPLVTKIFRISFAKIDSLKTILGDYSTKDKGTIATDERTNLLIVKDTAKVIEKMKRIVATLDSQTPQVLIETKIIEINERDSQSLGLSNGIQAGYDPFEVQETKGPGFSFSTASQYIKDGKSSQSTFGVVISGFKKLLNLNFDLELLETEARSKVIANPKVIMQNKETATIESTDSEIFSVLTGTDENNKKTFTPQAFQASIKLQVTPQVTNQGSIALDINITKGHFTQEAGTNPSTKTRNMHTNVLVPSGSTVMLGGIYEYSTSESHSGIPYLKELPLVGWLFRTSYNPALKKQEVVIFLTPRILENETTTSS